MDLVWKNDHGVCLMIFLFPSFLPYLFECFCKKELSLLPHLFTLLFISAWTHVYLFYSVGYNSILSLSVAQIVAVSTFVPSDWLLGPFNKPHPFLSILSAKFAHCYWGVVVSRSSQQTELGKCIYTNPHLHTSISVSVYVKNYEFILIPLILI